MISDGVKLKINAVFSTAESWHSSSGLLFFGYGSFGTRGGRVKLNAFLLTCYKKRILR